MNTVTENNIDKLLEDISSITTVINRNKPVLQQLLHPARLRLFFLLVGLNLVAICLMLFFVIQHYGFFAAIPKPGRFVIYAALAVDLLLIQIFKRSVFLSSAQKIDPKLTLMGILKEIFTFRIIHVYVPIVVLVILFGFYFAHHRIPYYIVPTISIGVGLFYNCIGSIIDISSVGMACTFDTGIALKVGTVLSDMQLKLRAALCKTSGKLVGFHSEAEKRFVILFHDMPARDKQKIHQFVYNKLQEEIDEV